MPRTAIAINKLARGIGDAQTEPTFTTGDDANEHYWIYQAGDVLMVRNTGAITRTLDVHGPVNELGRAVDADAKVTVSVSPTVPRFFDLGELGWTQSGADSGRIHVDVNHSDLKLAVLRR